MTVAPWTTDERDTWLQDATLWITDTLGSLGLDAPGGITSVRERPWGAVLRVASSDRTLYFKAEGLGGAHEPVVLRDLAGSWGLLPDVLAFDDDRSWMLMADHGRPMWDVLDPAEQLSVFEDVATLYAEMQRSTASSVQRWIDLGVPDRRVALLPGLLERLLGGKLSGGEVSIDPDLRQGIAAAVPAFSEVCAELAGMPFADALDHGDLHGGNVLVGAGRPRLTDWGDSCVTHPFSSFLVTYQVAFVRLPADLRVEGASRLRDVYLESWSAYGSRASLRTMFNSAIWVAHISRALDYVNMLDGATPELVAEWHRNIIELLDQWQRRRELFGRDELIAAIFA